MRLGIDGRRIRPFSAGIGQFTEQLAWALSTEVDTGTDELILYGFEQEKFNGFSNLSLRFTEVPVGHPREQYHFARRINKDSIDVFFSPGKFIPEADNCKNISVVYDLCFEKLPDLYPNNVYEAEKESFRKKIELSELVFAISRQTAADITTNYPEAKDKVELLSQSVHPAFCNHTHESGEQSNAEPPYLLFVGTLHPRKNIELLIDAYNRIAERIPHRLMLVGKTGWNYDKINQKIKASPHSEKINTPGAIFKNQELANIYRSAAILVYPSLCEGFGRPLLEAMHTETPIICSDIPVHREVAGAAARFFPAKDPGALAGEIKKVVNNDSIQKDLVKKGKEQAKKYSWEDAARKLLTEARKLI